MDPEATLREAESYLSRHDERVNCAESLEAYFGWRLRGGFEPYPGADVKAMQILRSLGRVADTLGDALMCRMDPV